MAFKLVGDQVDGIKKKQKKRVKELLLNNIPENEVFIMRNGRFACIVCEHRPVFDSLEVLSIHRKGKKHLQATTRKIHNREISISKAIVTQYSTEAPMLAKSKQAKIDCLAESKPISDVISGTKDICTDSAAKRKCLDQTIADLYTPSGDSTLAKNTKNSRQPKKPIYVFPWKHKVGNKRPSSKPADHAPAVNKKLMDIPLRSSGWIPNGDGTWSKEEGVEFDSDEDSPGPPQL